MGLAAVLLRVRRLGPNAAGRGVAKPGHQLSRGAGALGRPAAPPTGGHRAPEGRQDHRVRELEWSYPSARLARPGGAELWRVARCGPGATVRIRDPDPSVGEL